MKQQNIGKRERKKNEKKMKARRQWRGGVGGGGGGSWELDLAASESNALLFYELYVYKHYIIDMEISFSVARERRIQHTRQSGSN